MSANSAPGKPTDRDKPSLLDPKATGGLIALGGFDFQRRYVLIRMLELYPDASFSAILPEGAEDVDVRFEREGKAERQAIQVKNHRVTTSEGKEIIDSLIRLDKGSPGTWSSFVVACAGMDDKLMTIQRGLDRYRPAGGFYGPGDAILANTRDDVAKRIEEAGLCDERKEFVLEKVTFEPNLEVYKEDSWIRGRALELIQSHSNVDFRAADAIFNRLVYLVAGSTATPITRQQIQDTIQGPLPGRSAPARTPFRQMKADALRGRLDALGADYRAATAQLDATLDNVTRERIKRGIKILESEIQQVEEELDNL